VREKIDLFYLRQGKEKTAVLVLAWPEVTARSEDKIMKWLRKVGIVKNLNVLVGHAAMMIADGPDLRYYDFGRYITPHHMGRVRSAKTDPRLTFETRVRWTEENDIENIEEICAELESKSRYTHGEGKLWLTVYTSPRTDLVEAKALDMQKRGLIGYNTFDKTQSNCARFVQTCILAGLQQNKTHFLRFNWPVTYNAPTPYFNILAATIDKKYYIEWKNGLFIRRQESLLQSYWDITVKVFSSMSRSVTQKLSDDRVVGQLMKPDKKPDSVPEDAVFLGGIGEAAWYHYSAENERVLKAIRWSSDGLLDYESHYQIDEPHVTYISKKKIRLVHDSHKAWLTMQSVDGKTFRLYEVDR
jgi:hypothetical protein